MNNFETNDSGTDGSATNTAEVSRLFDGLNHIEEVASGMIARIAHMEDEQVMMARSYAHTMGAASWRVECACDAEIMRRVRLKGGRGNHDTGSVGVMAAISSAAAEIGISTRTIRNNADIYERFLKDPTLSSQTENLDEKQFFTEALRAPEPSKAIQIFAEKKAREPLYSTREAKNDVNALLVLDQPLHSDASPVHSDASPVHSDASPATAQADWRRQVESLLAQALLLLPEPFFPTYVLAIERTKRSMREVDIDGRKIPDVGPKIEDKF